jgi:hypothetical protein
MMEVAMAVTCTRIDDEDFVDARTKAYLERNEYLQIAWKRGRGMPGAGPIGRVTDDGDGDHEPSRMTFDDAQNQRLRDAAQADYAQRIANAWRGNRG